jgi:hypothetical protein
MAAALLVVLGGAAAADEGTPLLTAHGVVEKVGKDTLTVQPRTEAGKFGKAIVLRVTGTSRISLLGSRVTDGKVVFTQKDVDFKVLRAKQPVAVVYSTSKKDNVLLTAVVQPGPAR